jgi:hypothetical protein
MAILLVGMLVCPGNRCCADGQLEKSESHCGNEQTIGSILIPEEHDPLPCPNAGHSLSKLSVLRL